MTTLGAIMDREDCRKIVVCNTCYAIKTAVPGSKVAVMVADHYLPPEVTMVVTLFLTTVMTNLVLDFCWILRRMLKFS